MKRDYSFSLIILPLLILLIFATSLFVERSGVKYEVSTNYDNLNFLEPKILKVKDYFPQKVTDCLVLYNSQAQLGERKHVETVLSALDSMQVKYKLYDISNNTNFDLHLYQIVVVSFLDLDKIQARILELDNWVSTGGKVLFTIRPELSQTFLSIYRKLGIVSLGDDFVIARGVEFKTDLLPGAKGISLGLDLFYHDSYAVELSDDARIHLVSADQRKTPLLWESVYGKGRFVFINSDQFNDKSSRGIIGAAYSLLPDVFVYPVINSSVFYIDDFPAPIREGSFDLITKQYNRDIQSFFINVWWPDLEEISRKYHIRFTGVMIETYNDLVDPPFSKQPDIERHQYFGGLLLRNGGELGFHGYNHVPLCLAEDNVNQVLEYPGWPSTESMQLSLYELYSFANKLLPGNSFVTYVPPSNILCPESRKWLPEALPGLKVVASVYLPDEEGMVYEQEFAEASDGVIEFPRIIAGYEITEYMRWAALNELGLHYVNSHFVHPDDLLDVERGAEKGWAYLRDQFDSYVKWLTSAVPSLRQMTAREGGMAVQRYSRLAVMTQSENGLYKISLGNFYDEAWLMMRTSKLPQPVKGCSIVPVAMNLYLIQATGPEIIIEFKE